LVKRKTVFVVFASLLLAGCSNTQRTGIVADGTTDNAPHAVPKSSGLTLPSKAFSKLPDGSLEIRGHWKLKTSEAPSGQAPYGSQPLNSTIIRCWPSRRTCEEYRAHVSDAGVLFSLEPMTYRVALWDGGTVVATWDVAPDVRYLFHIGLSSEDIEMEFRRQPSPGRGRVFERWVLE
jgi:hypothetical protein